MSRALKARPENLVVAGAITGASPFPRHRSRTPRECPGGREATDRRAGVVVLRPGGCPREAGGGAGRVLTPAKAHRSGGALGRKPPDGADAQTGGLYMSHELGLNLTPALAVAADANDYGSICDEYINPFMDLMPAFCGDPGSPRTAWTNAFEGAGGVLAGGAVGYGFGDAGRLRVELEYFFREAAHNEASPVQGRGGVTVGQARRRGGVGRGPDRQRHGARPVRQPAAGPRELRAGHRLRGRRRGARVHAHGPRSAVGQEQRPRPDHLDRRALPAGPARRPPRRPAQPRVDGDQQPDRADRPALRLPGAGRARLRAHRLGLARL